MAQVQEKQNITLRLSRETLKKARILAVRRSTSLSGLLTSQIEKLAGEEDAYERAKRESLALMEKGFHLGGVHEFDRDALHERR
jgi:HSP90 family molecular chaperone